MSCMASVRVLAASFFHQFVWTCENCILCIFTYLVSHASDIHHAEDLYIAAFWFCLWHWAVDSCWSSTLQPPTMGSNSCDVHHYVRAPLGRIFALDPDYGTVTPLGDRRWIAKDYCSSSASMLQPTQRAPLSPDCAALHCFTWWDDSALH